MRKQPYRDCQITRTENQTSVKCHEFHFLGLFCLELPDHLIHCGLHFGECIELNGRPCLEIFDAWVGTHLLGRDPLSAGAVLQRSLGACLGSGAPGPRRTGAGLLRLERVETGYLRAKTEAPAVRGRRGVAAHLTEARTEGTPQNPSQEAPKGGPLAPQTPCSGSAWDPRARGSLPVPRWGHATRAGIGDSLGFLDPFLGIRLGSAGPRFPFRPPVGTRHSGRGWGSTRVPVPSLECWFG